MCIYVCVSILYVYIYIYMYICILKSDENKKRNVCFSTGSIAPMNES